MECIHHAFVFYILGFRFGGGSRMILNALQGSWYGERLWLLIADMRDYKFESFGFLTCDGPVP